VTKETIIHYEQSMHRQMNAVVKIQFFQPLNEQCSEYMPELGL